MSPKIPANPDKVAMAMADIDESDVQAVVEVVRSGRLALGNKTIEFEEKMAAYVGTRHAIAVNSGTSALHLIIKAMGLGRGDEVLVPSFTFVSSVNAILFEGATPVFVDINPDDYNLDPIDLEKKITSRTKAIMVVDVFGHPAPWDEIIRVAQKHGLKVIDDSCEALGAQYRGRKVGQFGDAAAFAFYPNKQMTTGEGGMIVTHDDEIAKLARSYRNQGRPEMGQWLEHERLGYNYRLDEMSAALGVSQLKRLDSFLEKRERVAGFYGDALKGLDWVRTPVVKPDVQMSWFVYVVTLGKEIGRDQVMREMSEMGIPTRAYFSPIHLQKYIQERKIGIASVLPVTESVHAHTLALPFHNQMTRADVEWVVGGLKKAVLGKSSRKRAA